MNYSINSLILFNTVYWRFYDFCLYYIILGMLIGCGEDDTQTLNGGCTKSGKPYF